MTKMKRGLILALGATMVSAIAYAGATQPFEVAVDLANETASGDMISGRTSADPDVFIGCGIRSFDDGAGGATSFGFCQAEDAEGERAFCNTSNADLLAVIHASSDSSFVTYSWREDSPGVFTCTRIGFSNQSFYLGKHVKAN